MNIKKDLRGKDPEPSTGGSGDPKMPKKEPLIKKVTQKIFLSVRKILGHTKK